MNQLCWLCGWLEAGCIIAPHLIGRRIYNHSLCPGCRKSQAERIESLNTTVAAGFSLRRASDHMDASAAG